MATFTNEFGRVIELDPEFKSVAITETNRPKIISKSIIENANLRGMTPEEYVAIRGGINKFGAYGDSYGTLSGDGVGLTDEESAALVGQGGEARNAALAKKIFEKTGKVPTWWNTATPGYTSTIGNGAVGAGTGAGGSLVSSEEKAAKDAIAAEDLSKRQSAYDLLYNEFAQYGLADLVAPLKNLIQSGISPSEFTLRLRETPAYQTRFAANADRIKNGLAAISEAEYINLEDQYQNVMRNYGLPESYYTKGKYGVQEGFQKLIANDVDNVELEDRIMNAQNRVINSNPEVLASLKSFYPEITNGDILAYALDPTNGKDVIKRKITAAEIGGAATQAGLTTSMNRAEELTKAGITKAKAQEGFETVAGGAPRGGQLASMYGENPYTQATAETEVFGLAGKTEAATQRKKVTGLEKATFGGQSGATSSALVRDRAGAY